MGTPIPAWFATSFDDGRVHIFPWQSYYDNARWTLPWTDDTSLALCQRLIYDPVVARHANLCVVGVWKHWRCKRCSQFVQPDAAVAHHLEKVLDVGQGLPQLLRVPKAVHPFHQKAPLPVMRENLLRHVRAEDKDGRPAGHQGDALPSCAAQAHGAAPSNLFPASHHVQRVEGFPVVAFE